MAQNLANTIRLADTYAACDDGEIRRVISPAEVLAHIEQLETLLAAHVRKLEETARGLRDGSVNPLHAANRLDKMARELGA